MPHWNVKLSNWARVFVGIYLAYMLMLGILLACLTTPMSGLDESYHYKRALQISEGHLFARSLGFHQWGGLLDRQAMAFEHWFDGIRNSGMPTRTDLAITEEKRISFLAPGKEMQWFPSTASYSPVPYIPAAIGLLLSHAVGASLLTQFVAGRIANLLVYVLVVAAICLTLPVGRLVTLAVLTTPTAIHLASTFNADPISNGLPIIFLASCLKMAATAKQNDLRAKLALFVLGSSLGLLKITCFIISPLVVILPVCAFRSSNLRICYCTALVVMCALLAALWNYAYPFVPGEEWHTGALPSATLHAILGHPAHEVGVLFTTIRFGITWWWTDAFSRFGGGPIPYFFKIEGDEPTLALLLIVALVVLESPTFRSWRCGMLLLVCGLAYTVMVLLAFQIGFSPPQAAVISGLQGRYFLIPMVLLLLSTKLLLPRWQFRKGYSYIIAGIFLVLNTVVINKALDLYGALWK